MGDAEVHPGVGTPARVSQTQMPRAPKGTQELQLMGEHMPWAEGRATLCLKPSPWSLLQAGEASPSDV